MGNWLEYKRWARHQQEKLAKKQRDAERNPKPRKKGTQTHFPEYF